MTKQLQAKLLTNPLRITGAIVSMLLLAASLQAADLPDGEGKDLVAKVCTACHGVQEFTDKKFTKKEWDEKVDQMAGRGARATDEEFDMIVVYLVKYFGKEAPPPEKSN